MNKSKIATISLTGILLIIMVGLVLYDLVDTRFLKKESTSVDSIDTNVELDISDEKIEWSNYENREITLTESITITESGVYNLSGEIENGFITVKTDGDIKLNLGGVTITNDKGPAIYIESANTVIISTVLDTKNTLADGKTYVFNGDSEIEGAIYSKDDLVLEGEGTLVVNGNKGDAIVCKDDLKINSGTYIITSEDDGIRGKDSLYILDGTFTINALGDGMKSTNDTDPTKGYVKIENGTFTITSTLDGIQAESKVLISNGIFDITTGGGSSNSSDKSGWESNSWGNASTDSDSAKGIKASDNIVLTGGNYHLNTSDDSIHSNNYVGIGGGIYTISSGDDGIHADSELVIDQGEIDIQKSYEGLEAETITIHDGNIKVVSSDDGLNAAGGNDSSAINRPQPGANHYANSSKSSLTINGGIIYVNASGDGLDANGSIYMNGGFVTVDGPANSGNGALDYDAEFKITGGTLIAVGSSGMSQGISSSSTQYGVLINFSSNYSSGTIITITDSNHNEVMSYTSGKSFSSIVFSSKNLSKGTYTVQINGNLEQTFTIDNISSIIGNSSMMGGKNEPGGRPDGKQPGSGGRR